MTTGGEPVGFPPLFCFRRDPFPNTAAAAAAAAAAAVFYFLFFVLLSGFVSAPAGHGRSQAEERDHRQEGGRAPGCRINLASVSTIVS